MSLVTPPRTVAAVWSVCLAASVVVSGAGPAGADVDRSPRETAASAPAVEALTSGAESIPYETPPPPAEEVETRGAPANPMPVELTQPDGTTFSARQWGDGVFGGHELLDGHTIEQRDDGTWVHVEGVDAAGDVVVGDTPAHLPPPAGVPAGVRGEDPGPLPSPSAAEPSTAPHVPHTGTARTLVILARFADQAPNTTAASWASAFFGASNSVRDYYLDSSYGALSITAAAESHGTADDGVVGWVSLARNHPNTGDIDTTTDYQNLNGTVRDAVVAADPYVDFSAFDTNGNGHIEPRELHVVVITAGFEASYSSACGNTVWGHQWSLYHADPPTVDGKSVAAPDGEGFYTMFGERHCSSGSDDHRATIGIMVHEIGHDLGWPDLYDVSGETQGGVGSWSVMATGSWNATTGQWAGATPPLPDAFSRSYQGWVNPTQVTGTGQVRAVPAASGSSTVYRVLSNPGGVDWAFVSSGNQRGNGEYFLIENRTQSGWDAALPGCGILIWHIDEDRSTTQPNVVPNHRLVQLEQADGLGHIDGDGNRGDAGDPFPGSSNRTLFAVGTTPGSRLYSGADSGVSVQIPSGACASSKTITISAGGGSTPTTPPNDSFSSPVTLTGSSGTRTATTVGATKQAGEPDHGGQPGGASIWYRWTAPTTGRLQVNLAGSSYDTTLGVYVGGTVSSLVTVAGNDDSGGPQSRVQSVPVVGGSVYHFGVDGYAGATGNVNLTYTLTATPGPAPIAGWTAFVNRQFQDFLGRAPTTSERATWVGRLTATPGDRGELIAFLRTSSRQAGVVDPIVRLYRAYFLRHPDAAGLQYWITQRYGGQSLFRVSQSFSGASEFTNRYGTLTNRQFVELIYQNILGRAGEPAGVDYWTAELDTHKRSRGEVMVGFSEAPEYRSSSRVETDLAVITLTMLERRPLPHETPLWRYERTQGRFRNARLGVWALAHADYSAT